MDCVVEVSQGLRYVCMYTNQMAPEACFGLSIPITTSLSPQPAVIEGTNNSGTLSFSQKVIANGLIRRVLLPCTRCIEQSTMA